MKIPHRLKHVKFESSSDTITSFAGLKLTTDLAIRLGIIRGLNQNLTVKKRNRGVPTADFVMSLVNTMLVGGDSLSDTRVLRQETATKDHVLYGLQIPAVRTAAETLRKFSVGNIRQLESVLGAAMRKGEDQIGGSSAITLDLDSSIFEAYGYQKQGVKYGYTGEKGFHPLLMFWSERRLLVAARLRSGNKNTAEGAASLVREGLSRLPQDRAIRMRADAGFYKKEFASFCEEKGIGFSISAMLTKPLKARIAVPENSWAVYPWEEGAEFTEFSYQPMKWSRPYRMLVKRTPYYEGQRLLPGMYFYTAVITSLRGAASSLIRHHLARGGAENYIEEFKNGIGARKLPSQNFVANWAYLVIAQLAYNLAQWFKLIILPTQEQSMQLKKLRLLWFSVAAKILRGGRQLRFALARDAATAAQFFRAQSLIQAL